MRVLAIHHEDWKLYLLRASSRQKHRNLGSLEEVIRAVGMPCDYHEAATEQPLRSDLHRYSHVVVLGGNMAAYDEERHPFLRQEMRIIEQALARGLPVLGICLGAQLLARIHGARVYRGLGGPELTWHPISMTEEGRSEPLLQAFPQEGVVFQWHYDTFDLPRDAVRLAKSSTYENQAFRIGGKVWAFQFHLEADPALVRSWLRTYAREAGASVADVERARQATELYMAAHVARAREFMHGFLGLVREAAQPPGGAPRSAGDPETEP